MLKEASALYPMFLISGIFKGYSNEEFIEEVIRMNSEIEEDLPGIDFSKVITVIAKINCRNPSKENWILEAPPSVPEWFLKSALYFLI